jgi:uncharacterized repeat protein (TIGR01451 family)
VSRIWSPVVCVAAMSLVAPAVALGQGTGLFVTVAARECPNYTDIAANLARNNIQESLKDLGVDSPYKAGVGINPATEDKYQPNCKPITGWSFTLGTGIQAHGSTGPWGALSIVTNPFADIHTTQDSTALLGLDANPVTPAATIKGATTFELSVDEAKLATKSSSLWIQGGIQDKLHSDPVMNTAFPGQFGFGALRCAIDNLNGDNVEWIQFPADVSHVFCYAYYVRPPPTSGTIIIRKQLVSGATDTKTFNFGGNVSYNPGGTFDLAVTKGAPASITFYRAAVTAGSPWIVRENVPAGWTLADLTCSGASPTTIDKPGAQVSIALVAADTVTCTFTNKLTPPPGQLLLSKVTLGGVGTFGFTVTPDGSSTVAARASATTTKPGIAVNAQPSPISLAAGNYRVDESVPARSDEGRWTTTTILCNGAALTPNPPVLVTLVSGAGTACTFTNTFIPSGSLSIGKVTFGATGTAGFVIEPADAPDQQIRLSATTTDEGVEAAATGGSTNRLELGRYVIVETSPTTPMDGDWTLDAVVCNGELQPFGVGRVIVTLTADEPSVHCAFTDRFTPAPTPPEPQPPEPPEPPSPPNPAPGAGTQPDVDIGKTASQSTAQVDELVSYTIPVRNNGRRTAQQIVVADLPDEGGIVVSARTSAGACHRDGKITACEIGNLKPGRTATVRVTMRVTTVGTTDNFAAAGSRTPDLRLVSNKAVARVHVFRAAPRRHHHHFVACPARVPRAHIAC